MKTRVISGVVGAAIALVVLLLLPSWCLNIAMALLAAVAVYELQRVMGIKHIGMLLISMALAAFVPFWPFLEFVSPYFLAVSVILWYTVVVAIMLVAGHKTLSVEQAGLAYMMTLAVSAGFACIAYLRGMEHGLFYVIVTLLMAWMCDTGAYFAGTLFGKHKLCPIISPKKTVEGLIGGIAVQVLICLLAGWIYTLIDPKADVQYGFLALLALVCAPLSVFGDLLASVIKRRYGAKDYGNLMPGHGGVMDRFDSLVLVAPVVFWAMQLMPLVK